VSATTTTVTATTAAMTTTPPMLCPCRVSGESQGRNR
jgi:hypothetical protein